MKNFLMSLSIIVLFLLTACHQEEAPKKISCSDSTAGKTKAEQQAIADACFRAGSFKKSPTVNW